MERSFDNAVGVGVPLTKLLFFCSKSEMQGIEYKQSKKPNHTKGSSGHLKGSFGNSLELFANHPKVLLMKVRKRYKSNKNFGKPFSSNCCSGHTECLFMEFPGNLLLKLWTIHNQNTETKKEHSLPGKKSEKKPGHQKCSFKIPDSKISLKSPKTFRSMSKCAGKKVCKNKSTKRLVDRYNAILTKLSEFFSTKNQTYSLNDCFEVKKLQVFLKRSYCLRNILLDK